MSVSIQDQDDNPRMIAFQGAPGAYSDMAVRALFPGARTVPCESFAAAFAAVRDGAAHNAVIPVDNTLAGRVADVHDLLGGRNAGPGLAVVGEYFLAVRHNLLGPRGAHIAQVRHVWSHTHALPQCRLLLQRIGAEPHIHADTAGAAADIARLNDPAHAAIASTLAAELYGLDILEADVQDADHNHTRFLVLAREAVTPPYDPEQRYITSMVFQVQNNPAALYKALGGFATNGVNLAKLESYQDEQFKAARFYSEVEGHPDAPAMQEALKMMQHDTVMLRLLGTYPAHEFRNKTKE